MTHLAKDNFSALESNRQSVDDINATSFNFSSRNIISIQHSVFDKFKSLNSLLLSSNGITEVPKGLFEHLSELEKISLDNNQIKELDSNIFAFNQKLIFVSLNGNKIEFLHSRVFRNLPNLETLHLSNNQLKFFDFNLLKDSPKLKELFLSDNNLYEINNFNSHKIFWKNIKKIDLTNNNIFCVQTLLDNSDKSVFLLDSKSKDCIPCADIQKFSSFKEESVKKLIDERDELVQKVEEFAAAKGFYPELTADLKELLKEMADRKEEHKKLYDLISGLSSKLLDVHGQMDIKCEIPRIQ